jgi:hypothetical protein
VAQGPGCLMGASGRVLFDVFPDLGDHDGAFAHRRGHPLYRSRPHVAEDNRTRSVTKT